MAKKTGLGRGLGALIENVETVNTENQGILEIDIQQIEPNLEQPRKFFDEEKIQELADSIQKHGLIQPLIVSKVGDYYKIIAGERRWRAAKKAGLKKLPVVVKEVSSKELMELAIIENVQREDLNPLEEAIAYEKLSTDFSMTQEDIAESVGKSRSAVANTMRLLSLTEGVQKMIVEGSLSAGHARCIAGIKEPELQSKVAAMVIAMSWNVRQTEEYVKNLYATKNKKKEKQQKDPSRAVEIQYVERTLREIFNTKVSIKDVENKGKIEIEYYSADERERILELLQKK